jgi:hypothetical protein
MKVLINLWLILVLINCSGWNITIKPPDDLLPPVFTPTPSMPDEPTQLPTQTMVDGQGYVQGTAKILVSNLSENPTQEKESIFCLYNNETGAWVNIRHRANNKYQPKGALNQRYGCHGEINWHYMKNAGNGIWVVNWIADGNDTIVNIKSPADSPCEFRLNGGIAGFRIIKHGSADGRIPLASPATVEILEISGIIGNYTECNEN